MSETADAGTYRNVPGVPDQHRGTKINTPIRKRLRAPARDSSGNKAHEKLRSAVLRCQGIIAMQNFALSR